MKKDYTYSVESRREAMKSQKSVKLELKVEELAVLKEILENEVSSYGAFVSRSRRNEMKELKNYVDKLRDINVRLEKQLAYASGV